MPENPDSDGASSGSELDWGGYDGDDKYDDEEGYDDDEGDDDEAGEADDDEAGEADDDEAGEADDDEEDEADDGEEKNSNEANGPSIENDDSKPLSQPLSVIFGSSNNLPGEQKRVVRIFLSSTFTDMKVERNALVSSVFPKLKKYCQETYQLEFQVVDMRWGVQDQASDDHSTSELCMREIINCQKESAGPNFVCLLGDRYGTRYLKKYIPEEQWIIIVSRIRSSQVKELLDVWYKLDTNTKVPQRILQSISTIENGMEKWAKSFPLMYEAFSHAARQAMTDGELSTAAGQTFIRSVTEEEIELSGMLSDNDSQTEGKCLAFFRKIKNINMQHAKASRFIDQNDEKEVDDEKQALLNQLKEKVKANTPTQYIKEYSIEWSDDEGINTEAHKEYLQQFCDDFYGRVKELVDIYAQTQDESSEAINKNEIAREVLTHSRQAVDKLSRVVARTDILDMLKDYITGQSHRPLVVHGNSGCGKTSIMASVAVEVEKWLTAREGKSAVVLRFLGTTQASSDIERLLKSLTAQLNSIINCSIGPISDKTSSKSLKDLIREFKKLISGWKKQKRTLVVVLDSVDQLRKNDSAYNLSWLPDKLPKNVKFVISTLPNAHGILKSAMSFNLPMENIVEVKAMEEGAAWTVIDKWLDMGDRKISEEQRAAISATFKDRQLPPLYIKLVFDVVVKWTSYCTTMTIPGDVTACMDHLFTSLETTHGKLQVELALAYLTCCPGGISENELEDVLSIDDEFLTTVFQYHIPPVRRIPPSLWVRIKNDIRDYLVEKESFGVAALTWYHRQFMEHATKRYIQENTNARHCLNTLADYFTGRWANLSKPFTYTQSQMKKLQISDPSVTAARYVAAQPTRYSRHEFNGRKISVLSQLWSNPVLKDDVYMNSSRYIMDIEFLTGKFVHDLWSNINEELSALGESIINQEPKPALGSDEQIYTVEFNHIHAVLKMYSGLLATTPLALPAQLFACLQDKYNMASPRLPSNESPPNLAWFLTDLITGKGADICPLMPVSQTLVAPGGAQIIARQQSYLSKLFSLTFKGQSAIISFGSEMVMHVMEDGAVTEKLTMPLPMEPDQGKLVSFGEGEDYIFGHFSGTFCLISLDHRRVDMHVDEILAGKGRDEVFMSSEIINIFRNPFLKGKDSLMFYTCEKELVVIYSLALAKVVWHQIIPNDPYSLPENAVYHTSLHSTSQEDVKTFIVVRTGQTDIYELKMLKDGDVTLTLQETRRTEIFNGAAEDVPVVCSRGTSDMRWRDGVDFIIPELPCGNRVLISDKAAVRENVWSSYEIRRICDVMVVGKMRSERNLMAVYTQNVHPPVIELYSVKGHDKLHHSASLQATQNVAFIFLAPQSDTLLVADKAKVSAYFLVEQEWPLIEVTPTFQLVVASNDLKDILVDPRGYLVVTSEQECTKFWDVTLLGESEAADANPRLCSTEEALMVRHSPESHNCCISLQHKVYLLDVTTNNCLGSISGTAKGAEAIVADFCPGNDAYNFHIVALFEEIDAPFTTMVYAGVSLSLNKHGKRDAKVDILETHRLEVMSTAVVYDGGIFTVDEDITSFYNLKSAEMSAAPGGALSLANLKADNGETVGFIADEYCFADDYLLISGQQEGESEDCILVYDMKTYKIAKKFSNQAFLDAIYFKNFGRVVLKGHNEQLDVLTLNDLSLETVCLEEEHGTLHMLENYSLHEGRYNTDMQPFFYLVSGKKGLMKLNITEADKWKDGKGIHCLSVLPNFYGETRISHDKTYLAGVKNSLSALEILKLKDTTLTVLGEVSFQGSIDKFFFSSDDKYITVTLASGEVVCVKILDSTGVELVAEANKLSCTKKPVCQNKEDMMKDGRWKSMAVNSKGLANRDADTLYHYISSSTKNSPIPLIGTKEFKKMFSQLVDGDGQYVALVDTELKERVASPTPQVGVASSTPRLGVASPIPQVGVASPMPQIKEAGKTMKKTPRPPNAPKPSNLATINRANVKATQLPQDLLSAIKADPRAEDHVAGRILENEVIPASLKLYQDLPSDEKEKRLDAALHEVNSGVSAACAIL